jgi:uncharacterized protein YajQ (UPF0234 family)
MPSFDIVSQVDRQEVKNAVEQTNKEVANRFDFKGSDARVEQNDLALVVYADDEFKLGQVLDVLRARLAKRSVDIRALELGAIEKISGDKVKRPLTVKVGVPQEKARSRSSSRIPSSRSPPRSRATRCGFRARRETTCSRRSSS